MGPTVGRGEHESVSQNPARAELPGAAGQPACLWTAVLPWDSVPSTRMCLKIAELSFLVPSALWLLPAAASF